MRNEALEKAFLKRYGKTVECELVHNMDGKVLKDYTVTIKSPNNTFNITDYLKDGLTEYVLLKYNDKQWKHTSFLHAEVSVADIIGEENGNS